MGGGRCEVGDHLSEDRREGLDLVGCVCRGKEGTRHWAMQNAPMPGMGLTWDEVSGGDLS